MKFGAMIGWGIVIYAVMFLEWSLLVTYGYAVGIGPRLVSLAVLIVTAVIAGRSLRASGWSDILPYSLAWAVIAIGFDTLISVPFTGWALFADWNVWVGYGLIAVMPLTAPLLRRRTSAL